MTTPVKPSIRREWENKPIPLAEVTIDQVRASIAELGGLLPGIDVGQSFYPYREKIEYRIKELTKQLKRLEKIERSKS